MPKTLFLHQTFLILRFAMLKDAQVYISERIYANSRPIIFFLRLAGVFPLVVTRNQIGLILKFSLCYAVCSHILGAVFLVWGCYGQLTDIFSQKESIYVLSFIDTFPRLFVIMAFTLVCFCGIFIMPRKLPIFFDFVRCIHKADSILDTTYDQGEKYQSVLMLFGLYIYYFLTFVLSNYNAYKMLGDKIGIFAILSRNIGIDVVAEISLAVEYTNRHLVHGLEKRFVQLNKLLDKQYLELSTLPKSRYSHDSTKTLIELRKAYLILLDAATSLNKLFGLNSLLVVTSVFLLLIVNPYFLILILQGKRGGITELLSRAFFFSFHISRVMVVIEPWYSCLMQMEATKAYVCSLMSLKVDQEYRKQIDIFSKVICLRPFKSSACDLFQIDRFLVTTFIENITTYVVILLQAHD